MTVHEFYTKHPHEEIKEVFDNIKYIKKSNKYLGFELKDLKTYPYSKVCEFTKLFSTGNIILAISYLTGIKSEKIQKSNYKSYIYFVSLLYSYLDQIKTLSNHLNSITSDHDNSEQDLIEAGVERLNKYDYFGVIDELANGDLTKHKEIGDMPYEEIMTKLFRDKEKQVVKSNYEHIVRERSKK